MPSTPPQRTDALGRATLSIASKWQGGMSFVVDAPNYARQKVFADRFDLTKPLPAKIQIQLLKP